MSRTATITIMRRTMRDYRLYERLRRARPLTDAARRKRAKLRGRIELWRHRNRNQLALATARLRQLERQGATSDYWLKAVANAERRIAECQARAKVLR